MKLEYFWEVYIGNNGELILVFYVSPIQFNIKIELILLLVVLKEVGKCKAWRERLTPYKSEDPSGSPTTLTHKIKEEKGKLQETKRSEHQG